MKKKSITFTIISSFLIIFAFSFSIQAHAATPQELVAQYKNAIQTGDKVKILIVPGHDDEYTGTEFNDIREADVVVSIGQYLYDYLKNDPRLDVQITRTQTGYTDTFKNYFANNRQQIQDFIASSRTTHNDKIASGEIKAAESVPHNNANSEVAIRLYGINKWANENDVDITIHLHINDQGGRKWGVVGDYTGVSVYIPERQYSNAQVSSVVGEAIFNELKLKNHVSTYPAESKGLLEDQDLIAIGASNTARSAAALIEYGYIYEPQYQNLAIQEPVTKNLAYQTYLGVHRFFGDRATYAKNSPATPKITGVSVNTSYLPFEWTTDLKKGSAGNAVSALQAALTSSQVYTCGITATYGPCTEKGVKAFQKKHGIPQTGTLGPATRAKLNLLFKPR